MLFASRAENVLKRDKDGAPRFPVRDKRFRHSMESGSGCNNNKIAVRNDSWIFCANRGVEEFDSADGTFMFLVVCTRSGNACTFRPSLDFRLEIFVLRNSPSTHHDRQLFFV